MIMRKLPEICEIKTGKRDANHAIPSGKYRFYTCASQYSMCDTFSFSGEAVIVPGNGDIGLVFYYNGDFEAYQRTYVLNNIKIYPKYLYYHLVYRWRYINSDKQYGSTVRYVRMSNFTSYEVPVPTLDEQKRIVARIEELFSELDNSVETLQKTKQQLALYRQAVLKEAFDRIIPDSIMQAIKSVCNDIKVGIVIKPAQYYTDELNGIKAFRSANVREFRINDADWVYLSKEGHKSNLRSEIHTGDVLIVRSGYPGTACVVTEDYNNCNAIDILIAVPNTDIITPEYLCAFTNSPYGRKLVAEKKRGVAQAHLNVGGYSKMEIPVPDLSVQKQVVQSIEQRLSVYDSISKTIDIALQQAEAMRQSILKQAFEGRA